MKISLLMITLLPVMFAANAVTITDNFERPDTGPSYSIDGSVIGSGWVDNGNGSWRILNGVLEMNSIRNPAGLYNTTLETVSGNTTNFVLSGDVSANVYGGWSGIMFNYQNPSNYYVFRIKGGYSSYQVLGVEDGQNVTVLSKSDASITFSPGTMYTLTVTSDTPYVYQITVTEAGSVTVFNPTTSFVDQNFLFSAGYAGFYSPSDNAITPEASFDNFNLEVTTDYHVSREFESPAYIQYETIFRDPAGWYHKYYEDGFFGNIPTDDWTNDAVYLATERAYAGEQSLAILSLANSNSLKDRVELEIANWSWPNALRFGQTRYVGYRMYIDEPSGVFSKHFTQVWQANCAAKVPFTMTFNDDYDDWRWEATARSFTATEVFASQPISKGQWHTFIYKLVPRYAEDNQSGEISIWVDGELAGTYIGPWGEMPGHQWPGYDPTKESMSIRCGLYAGPADVFHPDQGLYFDDYRMGTSFDEVNPDSDRLEFEAESGELGGSMFRIAHSDASFGWYIEEPDGMTNGAGFVEYDFELDEATTVNLWLLAYGETGNDDSVYVSMDGETDRYCGILQGTTFQWKKLKEAGATEFLSYSLSAGSHTLRLTRREKGARIDKVFIQKPGDLDPASLTPRNRIELEAESGLLTEPFVIVNDLSASGGKYLSQTNLSGTGTADYDFFVGTNGTYNLWVCGCGTNSGTDSVFVSMDGSANMSCGLPVSSTGVMQWKKLTEWGGSTPLEFNLAGGYHTLRLSRREFNVHIDRLILVEENQSIHP